LTGIIEASRQSHPLIMQWKMLTPGIVRFEADEVFCTVMPVQQNYLEAWELAIHDLNDDPGLEQHPGTTKPRHHHFFGTGANATSRDDGLRLNPPIDRTGTYPVLAGDGAFAAAKWQPGSLMTSLDHAQNDANRMGRRRLRDGTLTPSPDTTVVAGDPGIDPDAFDFVYQPNFLTPAECALLTETAQALSVAQRVESVEDPFWKGRFLQFGDILLARPGAAALMRDAQSRVTQRLRTFYELTAPIFADTASLVRWRPGMFMTPHADRANPDGSHHNFAHRDFGSIIYINDDYEGGELYFPRLDLVVKPTLGLLVAFTGGWHHEHGVIRVRSKDRLTMAAFYTFDASHRERDMYALGSQ